MPQDSPTAADPLARPFDACLATVFPTPVATVAWADSAALNEALAARVLAEEAASPGVGRSNVGGWHSGTDFLRHPDPAVARRADRIRQVTREMTRRMMKPANHRMSLEGWANVLRRGQYNSLHLHPNATWSGVYYVTGNPPPEPGEGSPEYSGKIEFTDPRPGASAAYTVESAMQTRCLYNPGPGTMLIFPSWLQHQVHPYFGPGARISIAFNVLLTA